MKLDVLISEEKFNKTTKELASKSNRDYKNKMVRLRHTKTVAKLSNVSHSVFKFNGNKEPKCDFIIDIGSKDDNINSLKLGIRFERN